MKCIFKFIIITLAAGLILTIAGCSGLLKFKLDGGVLSGGSSEYSVAPVSYIPVSVGEAYARLRTGEVTTVFYVISGLDPKLWLTDDPGGAGAVFHPSGITLPPLTGFGADKLTICRPENVIGRNYAEITDRSVIGEVIAALVGDEQSVYPALPGESYRLDFESENYPGIYYSIVYVEYEDQAYIYDRATKHCAAVGDLFGDYTGFGRDPAE